MLNLFRDMLQDWEGRLILLLMLLVIATIPLSIAASIEEEHDWREFSEAHNCKKVAEMKGSIQNGVGYGLTSTGGTGTIFTTTVEPDKTGWLCDDGVTYWR
jgi:hypothetical protein